MRTHLDVATPRLYHDCMRMLALGCLAIGIAVIIGWRFDLEYLIQGAPGLVSMKVNTALCLCLCGIALWLLPSGGRSRRIAVIASMIVLLISASTLLEYAGGLDLGIDDVLVTGPLDSNASHAPGRMPPITAVELVLLASALFMLALNRWCRLSQGFALISGMIAVAVLTSYSYGMREFVGFARYMQMAWHTSLAMLLLSVGVLLARPKQGLVAAITANTVGGIMARRLLPVAMILPFLLNGMSQLGRRNSVWDEDFDMGVRVALSIGVFFAFIGRSAYLLHRMDLERREAVDGLRSALDALSSRLTAQTAVEAELRGSEERYRFLADAMPQIVWTADADGYATYFNRRWYDYSGLSTEESLGWAWKSVLHPDDTARIVEIWKRCLQTGEPYEVEYRFRRACDGIYNWQLARGVPMRDDAGTIIRWIGTCTDIDEQKRYEGKLRSAQEELEWRVHERTAELASANAGLTQQVSERIKAEAELRWGELRYRSLVEGMTAIVWNTPASGGFETEQPGWSAFTGQSFRRLAGWGWLEAVHEDDRRQTARIWSEAIANRTVYQCEHRLRRHDGEYRHMLVRAVPIPGEDGKIREWIGVHTDVDDQVRAKEAMREAKEAAEAATRAKGEFLANMSHEIRTPMNGILGLTELMLETELSSRQREYVSLVQSSAESLLTIIDDILDFSKIEAGRLELYPAPFGVRDCISETVKPLALRARPKGLGLTCRIAPSVPDHLVGDETRLRQVLVNLVGNAIKFTEHGEIVLTVEAASPPVDEELMLHLSVRDTGIGIPADKLQSILEPFIQADGSAPRQYGGTGLGLSICCKLVAMMGGRLWIESELDRGSTFHFTARFGIQQNPPRTDPAIIGLPYETFASPARSSLGGRQLRILLAEDHVVNQKVVTSMLERFGHDVKVVGDGRRAVEAVAEENFDLVLMDVQMPIMDGFKALAAIRLSEEATGRHTPVIALTAHAMKGDRERCLAGGFDAYVPKPVRVESFLATIRELSVNREACEAPAPREPVAAPAFNRASALEAFGGDEQLFQEILGLFIEDCPHRLRELREAILGDDPESIRRTAHTLQGTAGHFAATEVVTSAKRLEAIGRSGSCQGASEEYERLDAALSRFLDALDRVGHHDEAALSAGPARISGAI